MSGCYGERTMGGHSAYARGGHDGRYGGGYYGGNGPIYDTCDGYSGTAAPVLAFPLLAA